MERLSPPECVGTPGERLWKAGDWKCAMAGFCSQAVCQRLFSKSSLAQREFPLPVYWGTLQLSLPF